MNEAKARLREVEEGIAVLQATYEETSAKKEELVKKCSLCTARLERAEKVSGVFMLSNCVIVRVLSQLIGGLADEKVRWAESVAAADEHLKNVTGDVVISSGCVAYLGPFTVS